MIRISLSAAYMTVGGVVIMGILFTFFVLQPMYSNIEDIKEDMVKQKEMLEERTAFLRSIDAKVGQLRSQEEQERKLAIILPAEENTEDVVRILHQLATETGVVIQTVTNETQTIRSKVNAQRARGEEAGIPDLIDPLGATISITGTYQQFRAFLAALERAPRLMDVTSVSLTRANTNVGGVPIEQVSATLEIQFYSQQLPEYVTTEE